MADTVDEEEGKRALTLGEEWGKEYEDSKDLDLMDDREPDGISLFCDECLSPYRGEKLDCCKYMLRCSKCGYTRDVTDEELVKYPPIKNGVELYIGDLIANRFKPMKNFEKHMKQFDVTDPYNVEDDYTRIHDLEPHIRKGIEETIYDIRQIVDSYRMSHNLFVFAELIGLKKRIENTSIAGLKKKDKPKSFLVEINSHANNDGFLLDPNAFKFPDPVLCEIKKAGLNGVRHLDHYLLQIGIPKKHIKDCMPFYGNRLEIYRNAIACKYDPENTGPCSHSSRWLVDRELYLRDNRISDDEIDCENDFKCFIEKTKKCDGSCAWAKNQAVKILKAAKQHVRTHKKEHMNCDCNQDKKKGHRAQKCKHLTEAKGTMCLYKKREVDESVAQDGHAKILHDCLAARKASMEGLQEIIDHNKIKRVQASLQKHEAKDMVDSAIDFRIHCSTSNYEADFKEQLFIFEHLSCLSLDVVHNFRSEHLQRIYDEALTSLEIRKAFAYDERQRRSIAFLKASANHVREKVDQISDGIIFELKRAYMQKRKFAEKQKEVIEEAEYKLNEYNAILDDIDKKDAPGTHKILAEKEKQLIEFEKTLTMPRRGREAPPKEEPEDKVSANEDPDVESQDKENIKPVL